MTNKIETERAIEILEKAQGSGSFVDIEIVALETAITALRSQSEAERKIEEAIKQCKDQIQDAEDFFNGAEPENDFPEGRWKACRWILEILEGKTDERK